MYGVCTGMNENAIIVPFTIHTKDQTIIEEALINSGAMENFMDYRTVKRLGLGTRMLETVQPIINADGSPNGKGTILRYVELAVNHNRLERTQSFYVADLGSDRVLLGFPWLKEWNPKINWPLKKLEGGPVWAKTMQLPEWAKIGLLSCQAQRVVCHYQLQEGDTVYIQVNKVNMAQEWAIAAVKGKEKVVIPEEYKEYQDVFSEESAKQLPPSRGEFDHRIQFKEGAPATIRCKVYPMNCAETEFTRNWIQENLEAGKIQESQFEITCPSFLIKKKNRTFRMVQDYRPINAWTIPDNLPLPLIRAIVEDLEGMDVFSTFDI